MASTHTNASCPTCETTFRVPVHGDEDGAYAALELTGCPECGTMLCACCPEKFQCTGCDHTFCADCKVEAFGEAFCATCALEALEANEPECECRTDGDTFDPAGCELHDANSPWNVARRAAMRETLPERRPATSERRGVHVVKSA